VGIFCFVTDKIQRLIHLSPASLSDESEPPLPAASGLYATPPTGLYSKGAAAPRAGESEVP